MDLESLRAVVATMRELGVTEYAGIKLGPVPSAPPPPPGERVERTPEQEHVAKWTRITRASGAPIPPFRGAR